MASTKEMQARAKARKVADKQPKRAIDSEKFMYMINGLVYVIVQHNPDQDYEQSTESNSAAEGACRALGLENYLGDLLTIRQQFEQSIAKQYNVVMPTGLAALATDTGQLLRTAGVPLNTRIACGLIDSIIGIAANSSGAFTVKYV